MNPRALALLLLSFCVDAGANAARAAEIPVNVGVGPAAFYIPEHVDGEDPKPFYGLRLHVKAVIDRKTLKRHQSQIPASYRAAVEKMDEIRVGYLLIPESIMIGPRRAANDRSVYGATWQPIAVGVPIVLGPARFTVGTGLLLTYAALIYPDDTTHFLRPGADLGADLELRFTDDVLLSLGWSSAFYVPQKIGGGIGDVGADHLQSAVWRIHQAYVVFNYRIPVDTHF